MTGANHMQHMHEEATGVFQVYITFLGKIFKQNAPLWISHLVQNSFGIDLIILVYSATADQRPLEAQSDRAMNAECNGACFQVTARDAVLVATAQPITKDVADSLAHTALIHSKSFAKRRLAAIPHVHVLCPDQAHIIAASTQHQHRCTL